jgi:hypothetical protein
MGFWERKILERGVKREKDFEKKKKEKWGNEKQRDIV